MIRPALLLTCVLLITLSATAQNNPEVKKDSVQVLNEVTIKGSKKLITTKNGNLVMNVENSVLSAVTDPVDLLSKIPTVQVSPDGQSVSVVGKGEPLIYIDNQRMTMNDLRSLSVADIKTIEIVNNPSSKYEASGRSVILITRKLNKTQGIKGELSETAAVRKYYLNRTGTNISYRKKKLELKGSFQYNQLRTWEGNNFDFRINNANIFSRYSVTAVTTRPQFIYGAGLFYQVNEEDYISVNANMRKQNESFPIYTSSYLKTPSKEESVVTSNFNWQPVSHFTTNLNYNKKFKNKGTLFTGAQYTRYSEDTESFVMNEFNDEDAVRSQDRLQDSRINVIALRTDYERTFAKDVKWELGSAITHAASEGNTNILNYAPDEKINVAFDYNERNLAAYTQVSGKIDKVNYSGGLRLEDTKVRSKNTNNNVGSVFKRNSTQLFPKASISIPVDSSKTISFNYARTIYRPNYTNANQASVYINPYFEWANNINLGPSATQEITGKFQLKDYSLAVTLYQARGAIYSNFDYDDQLIRLRRTDINYDMESGVYTSLTVPFRYKIWSSTNVLNLIRTTIKDDSALTGKTRPFMYFNSTNEFRLPKNFVFTLSGWVVSKSYQGAYERNSLYAIDTALTKTLFKNLVCTIRYSDMFGTMNSDEKFAINDVAANGRFYDNVREFSVGLKYSFGKLKNSIYKNREVDENTNRVR